MGSLPEGHDIQRQARRFVACESGQRWEWDGVQFEMLHPHDETLASNDNGLSCVLKVSASGHSLLLTGDIEALQDAINEDRMAQRGWMVSKYGAVKDEHGRPLFKNGFVLAIQKVLAQV